MIIIVKAMQAHVNYTSAELGYKKVKADLPIESKEEFAKLEEKMENDEDLTKSVVCLNFPKINSD